MRNDAYFFSIFKGKKYNEVCPVVDVFWEEDFFLPCKSYRLLIPVKKKKSFGDLNIFEITVLKLLHLQKMDAEELSDLICCDADFISFIIISLVEREYLDDKYNLTDKGTAVIGEAANMDQAVALRSARIFALKGTLDLLPIICFDESEIQKGKTIGNKKLRIAVGDNAGTKQEKDYRYYSIKSVKSDGVPSRKTVEQLFREYIKLSDRLGMGYRLSDMNSDIDVEPAADVFIHFKAILQNGHIASESCMISDGFLGISSNSMVVKYLQENKELNFYENLLNRAGQKEMNSTKKVAQPMLRYAQVKKFLSKVQISSGNSLDELEKSKQKNINNIRYLYAALEWAFHYYVKINNIDSSVWNLLESGNSRDNSKLLKKMCERLGLNAYDGYLLSRCNGYELKKYHRSDSPVPRLEFLIPLCIADANYNDSDFLKLMEKMPCFMNSDRRLPDLSTIVKNVIVEASDTEEQSDAEKAAIENYLWNMPFSLVPLKGKANECRHGHVDVDKYIIEYWLKKVREIIEILLPDFGGNVISDGDRKENASRDKINALVSIWGILDSNVFNRLDSHIQQELLNMAPCFDGRRQLVAMDFVISLSKILEKTFRDVLKHEKLYWTSRYSKADALSVIKEKLYEHDLPDGLLRVNENFYNNAISSKANQRTTLGAVCLAWAAHNNSETYTGDNLYDILFLVDKIAKMRSHGNEISLKIDHAVLNECRMSVCKVISMLA